jgi:hypothetical protein
VRENSDEDLDDPFGDTVSAFQTMHLWMTSLPVDNVSMQQLTQLESEFLFHWTCQTDNCTTLLQEVTHLGMQVALFFISQDNTEHNWKL